MDDHLSIIHETPWDAQDKVDDSDSTTDERATLPPPEDEEGGAAPAPMVSPRIVEGTLVESTLLLERRWSRHRMIQAGLVITTWILPTLMLIVFLLAETIPGLADSLSRLVPGLIPRATVTIIPVSAELQATYMIAAVTGTPLDSRHEVYARLVSVTAPAQAQTVLTTGVGHLPATHATGLVTFYNVATYAQTIATGTVLTGADGVQVVTDQLAVIPASLPPIEGLVTVPAHAVQIGSRGNIAARDINKLCCVAGVAVQNLVAFSGGQEVRDYPMVAQRDFDSVAGPLTTTLTHRAQATFQAQIYSNEQEIGPVQCTPTVRADHPVGSEAVQVTVIVSVTCHGEIYDVQGAKALAASLLAQHATKELGPGYSVVSGMTTDIRQVTLVDAHGTLSLTVKAGGAWAYQFSEARLHDLARRIVGKSTQEAKALLLQMYGVRTVTVELAGGGTTLPTNPRLITIGVLVVIGT